MVGLQLFGLVDGEEKILAVLEVLDRLIFGLGEIPRCGNFDEKDAVFSGVKNGP